MVQVGKIQNLTSFSTAVLICTMHELIGRNRLGHYDKDSSTLKKKKIKIFEHKL